MMVLSIRINFRYDTGPSYRAIIGQSQAQWGDPRGDQTLSACACGVPKSDVVTHGVTAHTVAHMRVWMDYIAVTNL